MQIERLFTREGQDAFAGLNFVPRTSRIVNPNGSIVFEMNNVLVPEGWSQVATDILAQKYFRRAGVPQHYETVAEEGVPEWLRRSEPAGRAFALFCATAAVGLGGLLLLIPLKWGAWLVTWQARISIIIHSVVAFFIVAMTFGFGMMAWEKNALALRLGAIAVDLMLWTFLRSNAVIGFFAAQRSQRPQRAFEVTMNDAEAPSPAG